MLEKSFGLLFYLKQPKNQRRKDRFVYLRITVDGKSKELSTKRTWTTDRWNQGLGRATGSKEDTRTLNEYLESLIAKVYEAKKALLDKDRRLTAEILKNVVTGQGPERKDILDIFRKHIKVMISLKNIDFKPRTILYIMMNVVTPFRGKVASPLAAMSDGRMR
ncbi:Arm DNA-binding domain-containing protein [Pedobacter panaciterrae]